MALKEHRIGHRLPLHTVRGIVRFVANSAELTDAITRQLAVRYHTTPRKPVNREGFRTRGTSARSGDCDFSVHGSRGNCRSHLCRRVDGECCCIYSTESDLRRLCQAGAVDYHLSAIVGLKLVIVGMTLKVLLLASVPDEVVTVTNPVVPVAGTSAIR